MSRPHLLYIAFFFPPSRSSGVYRAMATVRAFHEAGWDVTVVTADERFFEDEIGSADRSLLASLPDDVDVERVPFTFRAEGVLDVRKIGWVRGNFPLLWSGLRRRTAGIWSAFDVIRGRSTDAYAMEDRYLAWIEPVVARAWVLTARKPFDHVLATGNPYSAFEAARIIATLHDVDFTVDYRDPWSFDVRTDGPARLTAGTLAAEERIISEAHACIQINEAIAAAYSDKFPDQAKKQIVVLNGYDESSIPDSIREPVSGPVVFGMLGTVTDLWPLTELFEAWHIARRSLPGGSVLRLGGHLGYFQWSAEMLESTFPSERDGFDYVGPVPKADVAGFYSAIDVVVVPLFGGPMLTAGKVLETAAVGIPIVCIQREDGGGRRLYSDHRLVVGAEPHPEEIASALLKTAELAMTVSVEERAEVRAEMTRYERRAALAPMVAVVNAALAERIAAR